MALGILSIIFIVLGVGAIIGQVLLYKGTGKDNSDEWIFILNLFLAVVISYLNYSALPDNFLGQRAIALLWGILAVIAFPLKIKFPKLLNVSKALLTISIIGGLIQLFL